MPGARSDSFGLRSVSTLSSVRLPEFWTPLGWSSPRSRPRFMLKRPVSLFPEPTPLGFERQFTLNPVTGVVPMSELFHLSLSLYFTSETYVFSLARFLRFSGLTSWGGRNPLRLPFSIS